MHRSKTRTRAALIISQIPALFLCGPPLASRADILYVTNNTTITVAGYSGDIQYVTNLTIPPFINGLPVTSIAPSAFQQCTSLTNLTIPDTVTNIGTFAFYYCSALVRADLGNGVATIGQRAFMYCFSLTNITIPEPVTSISDYTFAGSGLTQVTLNGRITSIGGDAFYACRNLLSITLPDSVQSIGNDAFWLCNSLQHAELGNGVTNIGGQAFTECTGLSTISIPATVIQIGGDAFVRCTNLAAINVSPSNTNYTSAAGVLFNKAQSTLYLYPALKPERVYVVPTSVTNIADFAFYACSNLSSVIIPNGITTIPNHAFQTCLNLTNITLPDSVNIIGFYAFTDCHLLSSISFGPALRTVGAYAFANCSNLTSLYFTGNAPTLGSSAFVSIPSNATAFYYIWTRRWSASLGGVRTATWQSPGLIHNGGFEIGDFTGWTLVGHTNGPLGIYNGVQSLPDLTHSGTYGATLGDTQIASLSQTISTIPGQYYVLSLWLKNLYAGTTQVFKLNWNTNGPATNTLITLLNPPAFPWTNLQFIVTAGGSTTTLEIQAENDPSYFGLDDVSLVLIDSPSFQAFEQVGDAFLLSWPTTPSLTYSVQYKTSLLQPDWSDLLGPFMATNHSATFLDTNTFQSFQRFYRLKLQVAGPQ